MDAAVVIGMDPHKRTVTIEVMDAQEHIHGHRQLTTDAADGFDQMMAFAPAWPDQVWAVEGCAGIGRHVAERLVLAGEHVVDVPAKLSARMRMFATGQGRKTDDTDAHSIALVGVRISGLHPVVNDAQLEVLRLLVDRRRRIGDDHIVKVCQLHRILLELIPGGAQKSLSAAQARRLLAGVRPKDVVGKTRKRVALELVEDLERIYARKKAADKELIALVREARTGLLDLHGIGPSGAAKLLVEVGDETRFPDKGHFASWTGTAPVDVSSGDHPHHRLSRGGNREINRVLHIMAVVQLRNPTEGRAYYDRKRAEGKSPNEAMRALKRRLSDIVYRTLLNDYVATNGAGSGGHRGASTGSSAAGSQPLPTLRRSHFPNPLNPTLRPRYRSRLDPSLTQRGAQRRATAQPTGSRLYMYMSLRWPPTSCQDRSRPSRSKPHDSAVRHDPSFQGSTYSSRRFTSPRSSAQEVRVWRASAMSPRRRYAAAIQ